MVACYLSQRWQLDYSAVERRRGVEHMRFLARVLDHIEEPVISLDRGLTQDMNFHNWAGLVWNFGAGLGSEVSLANFRKDIYLEFYNEAGQLVMGYKIYRCWVSEYQAMPDLDANANAIAIEHIKLENEGFERDTSVTEPVEPTLSIVAT